MTRKLGIVLTVLLGSTLSLAAPQFPCNSVEQYKVMLAALVQRSDELSTSLSELAEEIPTRCEIEAGGQSFEISTVQLRADLQSVAKEDDEDERKEALKDWQDDLKRRLERINAYEGGVDATAKPKLNEILNRREFRNVGKQDATAFFQEWVIKVLKMIFSHVFRDPGKIELAAKLFIWGICIIAGVLLLWALYRWVTRQSFDIPEREIIPFSPSARNWRDWMKEARLAVDRGDLRDAIHLAYWATISHLESSGAWKPDRARTPREYLRLISQVDVSRPLLTEITREFEYVWYGNRIPAAAQWQSFLAKVEQIGCR